MAHFCQRTFPFFRHLKGRYYGSSVTVKPSLAIAILKSGLGVNVPMFLWGPPGIGKSQIVAQIAADLKLPLIDIRAVLLDPVDLRGVPSVENGTTRWNPNPSASMSGNVRDRTCESH